MNCSNCTELFNDAGLGPSAVQKTALLPVISYFVVFPIMLVLGFSGNFICLVTFYKGYKEQRKAYIYQMFLILGDTLILILSISYVLCINVWGLRSPFPHILANNVGLRRNPVLMYFTAHLAIQLLQSTGLSATCFFVWVSFDRYQALTNTQAYALYNPVKRALVFAVICYPAGFLNHIYDYFRFYVVWNESEQAFRIETTPKNNIVRVAFFVNSAFWVMATVLLVVMAVMILVKYRKKMKAQEEIRIHGETNPLVSEDVLTVLLLSQSAMIVCGATFTVVCKGFLYFSSIQFIMTYILPIYPVTDLISICPAAFNFVTYIVFSGKFRKEVKEFLCCGKQNTPVYSI